MVAQSGYGSESWLASGKKYSFKTNYRKKTGLNTTPVFCYFIDFNLLFTMVQTLKLCYLSHMAKFGIKICGKWPFRNNLALSVGPVGANKYHIT